MPENEVEEVEQIRTTDAKVASRREAVRAGLAIVAEVAHGRQVSLGFWPDDVEGVDFRAFFADMHSKVTAAYESYKEERDPKHLTWIDPTTGGEVEPGKGIPQGLAIDLMEIVFDVIGFTAGVGIEAPEIAAGMVVAMDVEDLDDDFDLDSVLGGDVDSPSEAASGDVAEPPTEKPAIP